MNRLRPTNLNPRQTRIRSRAGALCPAVEIDVARQAQMRTNGASEHRRTWSRPDRVVLCPSGWD
jgi:hypothetical protein